MSMVLFLLTQDSVCEISSRIEIRRGRRGIDIFIYEKNVTVSSVHIMVSFRDCVFFSHLSDCVVRYFQN